MHSWDINIEMALKGTPLENIDWVHLVHGRDKCGKTK
jgi:hypothetical protein